MEDNSPIDDRLFRIPPIVWVLSVSLVVALLANFVFNVAVKTVVYYGFFTLMMGSHFFMHGGNGGHQRGTTLDNSDSTKNEQPKHTGGCH
jgi:hypothetical protein